MRSAVATIVIVEPEPAPPLLVELEAIYRAYGFRAAHVAAHAALKRLGEEHRAELTEQGWCI